MLREYKDHVASRGIYAEFADEGELRRKVSQHLAAMMARLNRLTPATNPLAQSLGSKARVYLRTRPGQRSGDVNTVRVSAVIESISPQHPIHEYLVMLSVPKTCLTHAGGIIHGEVRQEASSSRRVLRRVHSEQGVVKQIDFPDKVEIFALEIGVDQLKMAGTYLAGDYEGTLRDKIELDVYMGQEHSHLERTVGDVFAQPSSDLMAV